ncbi:MAG: zinc dependent phospholipase C family protein [Bacteroidetes bacterium]|nr:zinc dependent phospholipase C family protein [Bacteroidota bacterium]
MVKRFLVYLALALLPLSSNAWGFFAHKLINEKAVYALPPGLIEFYKLNVIFITEHSVDPDLRKHSDEKEGGLHYMDIDHYDLKHPFDSVPKYWKDAVVKYSEDTLRKYGTLPWAIQEKYYQLIKAFKDKDKSKIMKLSADLGHYASDACVPLHATENYDGQLTNQKGIHKLWESSIPERYHDTYQLNMVVAGYISDPLKYTWTLLKKSYELSGKVLLKDKRLREKFLKDQIFEIHTGKKQKVFSKEYVEAFDKEIKGMVEAQLLESIKFVSSLWYTAWVEAGQPTL